MMTEMIEPLAVGAIGILTEDVAEHDGYSRMRKGDRFEVEDFVSEADSQQDDNEPFYYGNRVGQIHSVCVPAAVVSLDMTAEQARQRRIPTVTEMQRELVSAVCGHSGDDVEVDEAEPDGEARVSFYGETADGLRFACTVQIVALYQADF